jgi:hypothetical protein
MKFRRLFATVFTIFALSAAAIFVPGVLGAVQPAQAQLSNGFREALGPYGVWRHHPRFGEVWLPREVPRDWRPYEYGHWVFTEEWGWYWVSNEVEADWGWVAFHYGRWVYEPSWGWFWVPGDEWAPAWVDWRYGDDYVGWAPLPPDELLDIYETEPVYWVFLPPRYLIAPRPRIYFVPTHRRLFALRGTHVVNRTFAPQGLRVAVNPGIPAGFVARVTRRPLPTFQLKPHVLAGTQGVAGAVAMQPGKHGRVAPINIQRTNATIQPQATFVAPQPLSKGERGQFGAHKPRAAQGAAVPAVAPATGPAGAPAAVPTTPPKGPSAPLTVAPPAGAPKSPTTTAPTIAPQVKPPAPAVTQPTRQLRSKTPALQAQPPNPAVQTKPPGTPPHVTPPKPPVVQTKPPGTPPPQTNPQFAPSQVKPQSAAPQDKPRTVVRPPPQVRQPTVAKPSAPAVARPAPRKAPQVNAAQANAPQVNAPAKPGDNNLNAPK